MATLTLPILLAVTDNSSIRHWIKKQLGDRFFILDADKELIALNLARSNLLDYLVIDSQINDCDPFDLCQKLREINLAAPILYITGRLKKSYLDEALEAGVTDFLSDALDPHELEIRLATAKKSVSSREKTAGLSSLIKTPAQNLSSSIFSSKLILNEKAMQLLSKTAAAVLVIRLDQYESLEAEGLFESDELLAPLSDRLSKHLQKEDLLIPSSEGRFLMLLPRATQQEANKRAEELLSDIDHTPFSLHQKKTHLTISIAIGMCDANIEHYKKLTSSASKVLKKASTTSNFITTIGINNI